MEKYVLDTSLFFNMEPGLGLGKKTEEVIKKTTTAIIALKKEKKAEFFMPPRVVDELLSFFEDPNQTFLKEFLREITTKSPDVDRVDFSAQVFYRIVNDIRERSLRGLTIAEEELKKTAQTMLGGDAPTKKDFEIKVGTFVKTLRDRYRQATRFGFLDSVADLDLIVLAKEIDGYVVSSDEGVMRWGRAFGVKEIAPQIFGEKLAQYAG